MIKILAPSHFLTLLAMFLIFYVWGNVKQKAEAQKYVLNY